MADDLRIAVVGCGAMGATHIEMWGGVAGARVTAVCDAVSGRASQVACGIGAAAFDDPATMAGAGLADVFDICTPSGLHAEQALIAARHGLHVLCEKPLSLRLETADQVVEECERRDLRLGCVFQRRMYAGPRTVAAALASGKMGRVLTCSVAVKWWRPQSYYDSAAWRGTWALDGGVLANQAIHAIDHMNWMCGRVVDVEYAHIATESHKMEAEDLAVAVVRFADGSHGIIEATTSSDPPLCSRLELVCTNGAASFDDATATAYGVGGVDLLPTLGPPEELVGGRTDPMAISLKGHRAILADFAEAVREGRPPACDGRSAIMSVETLERIYATARVGRR